MTLLPRTATPSLTETRSSGKGIPRHGQRHRGAPSGSQHAQSPHSGVAAGGAADCEFKRQQLEGAFAIRCCGARELSVGSHLKPAPAAGVRRHDLPVTGAAGIDVAVADTSLSRNFNASLNLENYPNRAVWRIGACGNSKNPGVATSLTSKAGSKYSAWNVMAVMSALYQSKVAAFTPGSACGASRHLGEGR